MIGVNVAICDAGRVLLTQREDFEVWCLPGGGVDPGESLAQAAVREVREETGLEVRLLRLVGLYSRPRWRTEYHVAVFAAEVVGGTPLPQPDEVLAIDYFTPDALPPLMVGQRRRILDALAGVTGAVWAETDVFSPDLPQDDAGLQAARDAAGMTRAEFAARYLRDSTPPALEVAGRASKRTRRLLKTARRAVRSSRVKKIDRCPD